MTFRQTTVAAVLRERIEAARAAQEHADTTQAFSAAITAWRVRVELALDLARLSATPRAAQRQALKP